MVKTIGAGVVAFCLLAVLPALAAAEDDANRALYLRYCGACHGPQGKGDGVASSLLRPKPTDLTQLAKKNRGEFPYMRVVRVIDGRETKRAHGDAAMPVWGEIFQDQASWTQAQRAETQGKIQQITDYLHTVQAK
ncbi:MAG: c-type cytochrome [Candidatus Binatia bacterium]